MGSARLDKGENKAQRTNASLPMCIIQRLTFLKPFIVTVCHVVEHFLSVFYEVLVFSSWKQEKLRLTPSLIMSNRSKPQI